MTTVSFPDLVDEEGLQIELLLTHEDEVRSHQPGMAWRRKGWVVVERRLVGVVDGFTIDGAADLMRLLPEGLTVPFGTAELAAAMSRDRRLAQQMTYCLRSTGGIVAVGKRGNAVMYSIPG